MVTITTSILCCHKKYGWDNFEHTIVAKDLTAEEAAKLERELIAKYQSNNPLFGYNICNGGETNILPQSSIDKISMANKGRVMSDEVKRRRAENPNPPKAVRVVCDGTEFRSIGDCAKFYNVNPNTMRNWFYCIGYVPQYFVDMGLRPIGCDIEYIPCLSKRMWVFCDGKEYPSLQAFCNAENIPYGTVQNWFNGKYKMRKEYVNRDLKQEAKLFIKL